MTFDEQSGILFTSDICGSYDSGGKWSLFYEMDEKCLSCATNANEITAPFKCKVIESNCPLVALLHFQRQVMTSNAALRNALAIIRKINPKMIAPQHGSILSKPEDIDFVLKKLEETDNIGIDGVLANAKT
jgi:flavorubredoxin